MLTLEKTISYSIHPMNTALGCQASFKIMIIHVPVTYALHIESRVKFKHEIYGMELTTRNHISLLGCMMIIIIASSCAYEFICALLLVTFVLPGLLLHRDRSDFARKTVLKTGLNSLENMDF